MGSGTTGVAAKRLKRAFLGFEISPEFFKMADNRINPRKKK
ncbi:MAG: DNA methyltransferase [Gammaproteobacteria bacterium]